MELRLRTTHTLLRKVLIKDTEEIKHCSKRPWGMSKRVPRTTAQPRSGKLGCGGTKCYKGKTGVELQSALLRAILDHLTAFTYSRKNVKKNIIAKMNRFKTTNHLISNLIPELWFNKKQGVVDLYLTQLLTGHGNYRARFGLDFTPTCLMLEETEKRRWQGTFSVRFTTVKRELDTIFTRKPRSRGPDDENSAEKTTEETPTATTMK